MKKRTRSLLLKGILLLAMLVGSGFTAMHFIPKSAHAASYSANNWVFIAGGQSNMSGTGALVAGDNIAVPNAYRLTYNHTWVPAAEGTSVFFNSPDGTPGSIGDLVVGPMTSFASNVLSGINDTNINIYIVNIAYSGSSITQWAGNPGDDYSIALPYINDGLAIGQVKGFIWQQGEADGGMAESEYASRLQDLISRVRSYVGNSSLPVVAGQIQDGQPNNVNNALNDVAASDSLVRVSSAAGLNRPGGVHYDSPSQHIFGQRDAEQWLNIYQGGGSSNPTPTPIPTQTSTPTPTPTPSGGGQTTYISDLNWASATNGQGLTPNKDKSTNGNPLTLSGHVYAKGLGAHAFSTVVYNLNGAYQSFQSDVGVDDECYSGTVDFQVSVDGIQVFDSGVVTGGTVKHVNVSVAGKNQLTLVVTDGGDGISCDHADWAGALLSSGSGSSTPTPTQTPAPTPTPQPTAQPTSTPISGGQTYISDLNWASATNGINQVPNKDKSANGNPLALSGYVYAKGLGAHAFSTVIYNLNGAYQSFQSNVGVDDECYSGTVDFQVYVDGNQVFNSGVVTGGTVKSINVSVAGKNQLKLVVSDGGDGISCDHADWAGAFVQ